MEYLSRRTDRFQDSEVRWRSSYRHKLQLHAGSGFLPTVRSPHLSLSLLQDGSGLQILKILLLNQMFRMQLLPGFSILHRQYLRSCSLDFHLRRQEYRAILTDTLVVYIAMCILFFRFTYTCQTGTDSACHSLFQ